MSPFLRHLIVSALSLGATAWILPGVHVQSLVVLIVAGLVIGAINALLKPVLVLLTLPITVLSLGIFYLVLNGLLFGLAAALVPGFAVEGLGWAILGSLLMGLFNGLLGSGGEPRPRREHDR